MSDLGAIVARDAAFPTSPGAPRDLSWGGLSLIDDDRHIVLSLLRETRDVLSDVVGSVDSDDNGPLFDLLDAEFGDRIRMLLGQLDILDTMASRDPS